MLKEMDNIRFSREILDPPLPAVGLPKDVEPEKKVLRVGERSFNMTGKTRTELYGGSITVSIGDEKQQLPEAKEAVPWLQEVQQSSVNGSNFNILSKLFIDEMVFHTNSMKEDRKEADEEEIKKDKKQEIAQMLLELENE